MNKITLLGVTASGKTTLANKISEILNIPVTHMDKIFWRQKGGISQDIFISELEEIMKVDSWIIEGSAPRSKTLDLRIEKADTIIFYDLPLLVVLWRQTKRFFKYLNKVRPDMPESNSNIQRYPFTWKELQHALNYPISDIYSKILPYKDSKKVFIIKNKKDESSVIEYFSNQHTKAK